MRPTATSRETRALEQACAQTGLAPARLFERCGLLADSHDYHLKRFLHEFFPRGTAFPAHEVPRAPDDLPLAAGPRLQPRRHRHHRDRRRLLGAAPARRAARRHPHRGAGARLRAGLAPRRDRARAALDRLHAGAQVHHASRGRDPALFARPRRRAAGGFALRGPRRGLRGARAPHPPRARADRREPAPCRVRRPERGIRER